MWIRLACETDQTKPIQGTSTITKENKHASIRLLSLFGYIDMEL